MPKFGKEIDLIIEGVARLILAVSEVKNDPSHVWLREVMAPNWEAIASIMGSTYMSPEVIDSKVRYLSIILRVLYKYGNDSMRQVLRLDFIPSVLHLVLERLENNLLLPLQKYDQV